MEQEFPGPRADVAPARRAAKRPRTETGGGAFLRIDTELRRLDQLAGVGRLAAETAHEVRNALTAVRTLVQLLPTRGDDPELRGPFLTLASDELDRTERLLDALLAQAHGAPRDAAPDSEWRCVPGDAVHGVAQIVARRAAQQGVQITIDVEPELPAAAISGDALRQALLNLALNALAASPAGGDVRLAARRLDLGEQSAPAIELTVEDRGPGVPASLRRRVFEAWFSSDSGRVGGLGLAIVRDLLAAAHGSIVIEDRPGGGARMRVRIPALPPAAADSSSEPD